MKFPLALLYCPRRQGPAWKRNDGGSGRVWRVLSKRYFHDEKAAFERLEEIVWPKGPVCPHCGGKERIYDLSKTRMGLKKCGHCRKQFTVRVGTVFESSHIPLHKWFQAAYLMCASKKGISSHQLHRTLEVTYKTAWFMTHRLREAMKDLNPPPMGGEDRFVEADETYLGRKPKLKDYTYVSGKGWVLKSYYDRKQKILALVERDGRARSFHIGEMTVETIRPLLVTNVKRSTSLMTDEASHYRWAKKEFKEHQRVVHQKKEYARGNVTTNTVEGFFSLFKRGMKGIYQHCGEQHLHRYLVEFDFRYSNRKVGDITRAETALMGIVGKRLMYETPC